MRLELEQEESIELLSLVVDRIIAEAGLATKDRAAVKRWRSDRAAGTVEMDDLAVAVNQTLDTYLDEKMTRTIRRRGRYVSSRERAR